MDKKSGYVKLGVAGACVALVGVAGYFILLKLDLITKGIAGVIQILTPFIYGAALAYILAPVCNKFERLLGKIFPKIKRSAAATVSILLALALAVLVIWALVMLVFPHAWRSVVTLASSVPPALEKANAWLHDTLQSRPELQEYWDEFSKRVTTEVTQWLKTGLLPTVGNVVAEVGSQLKLFFTLMKNLFLGFLISIYFLGSRKLFAAQARLLLYGLLPGKAAKLVEEEVRYADRMFNGFLMGKLLDSAIIGVLCFIGTTLMGFESAALVSVIVGVTNIIPFFGPFIGAIPCAIILLLEAPMHCLYFIIFVVILQQLDGNLIGPKILGNSTGLSSFWVLFSILLFGGLWGVLGMIVGVPLFAVIYDVIRKLTGRGLTRHGAAGMRDAYDSEFHPAPDPEAAKPKRRRKKK